MDGNTNATGQHDEPNLFRPDTVITPDRAAAAPAQPEESTTTVVEAAAIPAPSPVPVQEAPAPQQFFDDQQYEPVPTEKGAVTWTASEFIAHQKSTGWYFQLGAAAVVIAVLVWFVTKDMVATATVIIGLLLLGVYAGRKPQQETYTLDDQGITIGSRHYGYEEFRSFAVVPEGAFLSIELSPLKRFAMYLTVYIDPADQDRILDVLSYHLPMEEARKNIADSLMRRIHF